MQQYSEMTAFQDRGLDAVIASDMGATFENGKFVFEYRSQDALSFRKFRTKDKRFWLEPKGVPLHLWNIDNLRGLSSRPKHPLVLTEGEFDAIAVSEACRNLYVSSVPNGANGHKSEGAIHSDSDFGFKYLWGPDGKLIPEIDQFDKVILATDDDEKGVLLRDELAIRIGETRCWHVSYLDGCKDANDVLRQYGAPSLAKVINAARPMRPGYLVKPSELPAREQLRTYSTGWADLDRRIKVARPELFVVTGIPGHGKTIFVRSLMFRLAKEHGWRTAFFTPEDPHERLTRAMYRFAAAHYPNMPPKSWADEFFRVSHPPQDERITLPMIMKEMESAALHHDCHAFVLDPWNEVSHDRGNRSETEYIEEALVDLKRKSKRLKLFQLISAHPRKMEDGKPNLYSISGSANWYNKCDHGVVIYRSTPDDTSTQVIVEKCKDHETMGRPGLAWMTYDNKTADFKVDDGGK